RVVGLVERKPGLAGPQLRLALNPAEVTWHAVGGSAVEAHVYRAFDYVVRLRIGARGGARIACDLTDPGEERHRRPGERPHRHHHPGQQGQHPLVRIARQPHGLASAAGACGGAEILSTVSAKTTATNAASTSPSPRLWPKRRRCRSCSARIGIST